MMIMIMMTTMMKSCILSRPKESYIREPSSTGRQCRQQNADCTSRREIEFSSPGAIMLVQAVLRVCRQSWSRSRCARQQTEDDDQTHYSNFKAVMKSKGRRRCSDK